MKPMKPTEICKHTKVVFAGLILIAVSCAPSFSADIDSEIRAKEEIVRTLRDEIAQIENETLRCEKSKKGWVAATVIGGTGVVATGIAAGVQGAKIHNQKQEIQKKNQQLRTLGN